LIFFFLFLQAGGRWEEFLSKCPLHYTGNRGSGADHIMGTVLLSVLNGHWRYAHINGIRGDGINPGLLGLRGTVSEDAVHSGSWLHLTRFRIPLVLDIDVTVKPLYGRLEGTVVGYKPRNPGRPSHVYHSYFVANLRISLGVEVRPENKRAAAKGLPELWEMLEKLPHDQWPTFSRGDSGYGCESIMLEHEERGLPYLFKLRHTPKVKELVVRMMRQGALWQDCGDGWQALETTLRLSGWTRERRIVLVRESPARALVARIGKPRRGKDRQNFLPKTLGEGRDAQATPWSGEISGNVTSLDPIEFPTTAKPFAPGRC
jgi:Transposase DDE domain group 1